MINAQETTVTINLESEIEVSRVSFGPLHSNLNSDEEDSTRDYKPSLIFTYNKPIQDFYSLYVIDGGDHDIRAEFWLDGEDVVINAKIYAHYVRILSVENSPLFTNSTQLYKEMDRMQKDSSISKDELNTYLLEQLKLHYNSPFSRVFSNTYVAVNYGDKEKISLIYPLIKNQSPRIKKYNEWALKISELNLFKKRSS